MHRLKLRLCECMRVRAATTDDIAPSRSGQAGLGGVARDKTRTDQGGKCTFSPRRDAPAARHTHRRPRAQLVRAHQLRQHKPAGALIFNADLLGS